MDETLSIVKTRPSSSSRKYGSTTTMRSNTINETYITHPIDQLDTLQGIALRYGVTMEQIRRANRMWSSDSLFLRERLLIPVHAPSVVIDDDDVMENSNSPDASTKSTTNHHRLSTASSTSSSSATTTSSSSSSSSSSSYTAAATTSSNNNNISPDQSKRCNHNNNNNNNKDLVNGNHDDHDVNEFLTRIDASIASTKVEVKKVQDNSDFITVYDRYDTLEPSSSNERRNHHRHAISRMKQQQQQKHNNNEKSRDVNVNNDQSCRRTDYGGGAGGVATVDGTRTVTPHAVVVVTQNSRMVRTTRKRNEQLEEDLFEL